MNDNWTLGQARQQKQDEFYTQLVDIENELRHYKTQFADKIVYCNCDDPYESNFFKFFAANFNAWGLNRSPKRYTPTNRTTTSRNLRLNHRSKGRFLTGLSSQVCNLPFFRLMSTR